MRILHISSARAFGGGERHLADLAKALARRGHEVYAALAPASPLHQKLAALPRENILTLRLRNALDLSSALELKRLVRDHQIEIVHAHMARDYTLASYATRGAHRARFIITRHVLFPLNKLHTLTLSHVARVIAVSDSVARALRAQRLVPAHKISVVRNGIALERFDDAGRNFRREEFCMNLGIAPERRLIGTVGEIKRLKGQEDFVRAASLVARRYDDVDFIIVGQDNSRTGEHLARLKQLIAELEMDSRVHLIGQTDDVAPLLPALDLFASASHMESFGLAIVEAMACGVAVIATATEGAREIITDGETGALVPIGDAQAMATVIIKLLEDTNKRNRIAARASETAREHFNLDRMVDATEQIYREALKE